MSTRDKLAEYAHEAWSGWMKYLFSKCECDVYGNIYIPADLAIRWGRQSTTPYKDLPEEEKKSGLSEADRILIIFDQAQDESYRAMAEELAKINRKILEETNGK